MIPIFIFVILLFPVPALIGYLFRNINHSTRSLPFYWVSGQVLLWALFQLLCVPFILLEQPFSKVVLYFNILTAILVVFSLFYLSFCWLWAKISGTMLTGNADVMRVHKHRPSLGQGTIPINKVHQSPVTI